MSSYELYEKWRQTIEQHEGGYEKFSQGYKTFGLNVGPNNEIVYREWAPNAETAHLIGDFSAFTRTRGD